MTRDEFCKYHWNYYMALEKDFLGIERYLTFDLGDNNSYDEKKEILIAAKIIGTEGLEPSLRTQAIALPTELRSRGEATSFRLLPGGV